MSPPTADGTDGQAGPLPGRAAQPPGSGGRHAGLRGLVRRVVDSGMLPTSASGVVAALRAAARAISGPLGAVVRYHALETPDRTALVDRHGPLAWNELDARATRLARALIAMGAEPGDAVATLLRNGREVVEVLLAAQRAGLVATPLNTWAQRPELAALLDRSPPAVLIVDERHRDQVRGVVPSATTEVVVGGALNDYEDLLAAQPTDPLPVVPRRLGPPPILVHTSGTTAVPKAAERGTGGPAGVGLVLTVLRTVPFHQDDVIVCPAPQFHSFGLLTTSLALMLGATLVLPDGFDAGEVLRLAERERATALSLVPVMLRRLVDAHRGGARADLSSVRVTLVSGSALPPELRRAAADVVGDTIHDLYGSTEAGIVAVASPEDARRRPGSVGRPPPGVDVVLFDDDGDPVPAGEVGRIHVRSGGRFAGYASGESTPEHAGYLGLGDLGRFDEEGYLTVVGRADDMVVVGGENVHASEVQRVLESLDGVDEAAVVGVPDEEYGQVLVAAVVGPADPEQLRDRLRGALPPYKVPRRIVRVDELPRTATGKVRRPAVTELLGS